ncbi:MAG: RNA polymerase sigma factor [Bacteroidota bacterium]
MQDLTDNALMLKVKKGDLDKLGLLYERHKKKLFGFFYNLGNNPSVSEDLVQNVFVRMLQYKNSFSGDGAFAAWMFRMARNVNYDYHKKTMKTEFSGNSFNIEIKDPMNDELNEEMEAEGNNALLRRAMAKLSEEKRQLLVLTKYKGLKFSELAEVIGCSEGAAKVRVHRALKELRSIFLELEIG